MSSETIYRCSNLLYCVYLTTYFGYKMPTLYIGSSSIKRIESGYHGSVCSKEWKDIWKQELKERPELFNTIILSRHSTRKEAIDQELILQKLFNVVKSPLFINKSLATPNGFFGMDISGEKHPMYGLKGKLNPNYGSKRSEETKIKISLSNTGICRPHSEETKIKISLSITGNNNGFFSKTHSIESKKKMSMGHKNTSDLICPHCGKIGNPGTMTRWHFNNCKFIELIT